MKAIYIIVASLGLISMIFRFLAGGFPLWSGRRLGRIPFVQNLFEGVSKNRPIIFLIIFILFSSLDLISQNIRRPHINGPGNIKVNLYTGNLFYERSDLFLPGISIDLDLQFFYSTARDTINAGFGYGWNFSLNLYYYSDSLGLNIIRGNGHRDLFVQNEGAYVAPAGVFDTLVEYQSNQFVLTTKYGDEYFFDDPAHQKLTRIVDRNGNIVTLTYTGNELSTITNAFGLSVNFEWTKGLLTKMVDVNSSPTRTFSYSYDNDRLVSAVDPLGNAEKYQYGENNEIITFTDKNDHPVAVSYNELSRAEKIIPCTDDHYQFTYIEGKTYYIRATPSGNQIYAYAFDEQGRNTAIADPLNNTRTFEYDDDNNLTKSTDYNGNSRVYTYDERGNLLTDTDPLGNTRSWTYTSFNETETATDQRGVLYQYDYDANKNLSAIDYPDGSQASFSYTANGRISNLVNNRGDTTNYFYDSFGYRSRNSYPIGEDLFEYTATGRGSKFTNSNNQETQFRYDDLDRLVSIIAPDQDSVSIAYDYVGNITSFTDRNDHITTYTYDPNGRLSSVSQNAETTTYEYAGDNLVAIANPLGNKSEFGFNEKNKIISKKDPLGNNTTFEYDKNGNLIRTAHPNGETVSYAYDKLNRLIERNYGDDVDYYSYDENGNITNAYNSHINISYEYNQRNQLISTTYNTWNKQITYEYDENGNRTQMTDPDNGTTIYTYDANNRLTQIDNAFNEITRINYDLLGLVASVEYGNGIVSHYSYTDINMIDSISIKKTTNEVVTNLSYTRDDVGNIISFKKDENPPTSYTYDDVYRLTRVDHSNGTIDEYNYDAAGNRKTFIDDQDTTSYQYNEGDQLLATNNASFNYDENGNLMEKTEAAQSTAYVFDGLNRLIRVELPNGDFEAYAYDPFDNRLQIVSASKPTRRFIYDGLNILMELDGSNTTQITYTSGLGIDSWISFRQNNETFFYHKDVLGSPVEISNANQEVVKTYSYDAFGSIISETGTLKNGITYTGREYDPDVQLFYYRSRFYDPKIGQFISKDKFSGRLFSPQSQHKYNYVDNNPVNYVDPLGQEKCFSGDDFVVKVGGAFLGSCLFAGGLSVAGVVTSPAALPACLIAGSTAGLITGATLLSEDLIKELQGRCDEEPPEEPSVSESDDEPSPPIRELPGPLPFEPIPLDLPRCDVCILRLDAYDPNEISGPVGYDIARWVSVDDDLGYTIFFENDPDFATAPAQVVDIRMPIDPELDIFSLRLSDFGFGFFSFQVPDNSTFYSDRLDVIDSLNVYVDVTAGIDVVKKEAFWIFESIDPATGLPPEDALTGFLPVNDTSINIYNDTLPKVGEGFVSFTIKPAKDAVTGDSIQAQASIVFDLNAPLKTNIWRNIVDAVAPVSALDSLPEHSETPSVLLSWTGVDDTTAVGVSHYEIYVSKNNGPFLLYQGNIDTTTLAFTGQEGSDYAFFVRAIDNVGNKEALKGVGEASTSIGKGLLVSPRIYLQGSYETETGLMRDLLRTNDFIPLGEPFTAFSYSHIGGGGESVLQSAFEVSNMDAIVDWVFLELRDKTDRTLVKATRSALLQRDGDVVDVDGVSPVIFASLPEDEYYLVVKHRNHLGAMSAAPVSLSSTTSVVDFTGNLDNIFGGVNGIADLGDGNLGLYSGDFNRNGQVQNTDFNAMLSTLGLAGLRPAISI